MTTSDRNILASKMEVDKGILVNLLTSGSNPFTKLAVITVASLWVIMNAERAEKPSESSKSISEFALQSYLSVFLRASSRFSECECLLLPSCCIHRYDEQKYNSYCDGRGG